jgi:methionyl-tRNA formyltransferase
VKKKVILLTSLREGFPALCIPPLANEAGIEITMIVFSHGFASNPRKASVRRLKKAMRIGLLGSLNGVRMRPWFNEDVCRLTGTTTVEELSHQLGLRLETTPSINAPTTIELFTEAKADLGISLGNSYISARVFGIPRLGMINVHHELPQYRGAQSAIWQLYDGSVETGFTIHQIDRHIDTGKVLYRETLPIDLRPTLRATVAHTCAQLFMESALRLPTVVRDYEVYSAAAREQAGGRTYTTPSIWQYLRMVRAHRRHVRSRGFVNTV